MAALASAGVRRFSVVDDDTVELSNLNRQIFYGPADVGRIKANVTGEVVAGVRRRNDVRAEATRVDGVETLRRLVAGADGLLLAADWPPYVLGRWVNQACIEAEVPFIAAGQIRRP